jgi:hypothetical protein
MKDVRPNHNNFVGTDRKTSDDSKPAFEMTSYHKTQEFSEKGGEE